jgi:hypothetical protein
MKTILTLIFSGFAILFDGCAFGQTPALPAELGPHTWTARVKVVGEDGTPIVGANVSVQYNVPTEPNSGDQTYGEVKGLTDKDGMFAADHTDSSDGLAVIASKSGYYDTHMGHQFYFDEKKRHPDFTLLLKKIGKPIPMYAKLIDSEPPVFKKTGQPPIAFTNTAGYDFMTGDWVAPYGKGVKADVFFTEEYNKKSRNDYYYKLSVSFPNKGDGIQGSARDWSLGVSGLISSNEAPMDGYQPKYEKTQTSISDKIYYFRIHTKLDDSGNVVSARYGKIYGDFMQFTYYLNPTPNDRDIEFDPKQNLIQGLQSFEQAKSP